MDYIAQYVTVAVSSFLLTVGPHYFVLCGVEVFGGSSQHPVWPDLTLLHTLVGEEGVSCKDTCLSQSMVCEPAYFKAINSHKVLKEKMNCTVVETVKDKYVCIVQSQ